MNKGTFLKINEQEERISSFLEFEFELPIKKKETNNRLKLEELKRTY